MQDCVTDSIPDFGRGRPKKGEVRPPKPAKGPRGRPKQYFTEFELKEARSTYNKRYQEHLKLRKQT